MSDANLGQVALMHAEWERFLSHGQANVRPEILQSWQRSQGYRVSIARNEAPTVLDDAALRDSLTLHRRLVEAAEPVMRDLSRLLVDSGQVVILCDERARVLRRQATGMPCASPVGSTSLLEPIGVSRALAPTRWARPSWPPSPC